MNNIEDKFTWKSGDVKILSKEEYEKERKRDENDPKMTIRKTSK